MILDGLHLWGLAERDTTMLSNCSWTIQTLNWMQELLVNGLHTELSCENGLKDVVQIAIGSFKVNKTDKTNNLFVDPVWISVYFVVYGFHTKLESAKRTIIVIIIFAVIMARRTLADNTPLLRNLELFAQKMKSAVTTKPISALRNVLNCPLKFTIKRWFLVQKEPEN